MATGRGRKHMYKTPEQLDRKIQEYFQRCEGKLVTDQNGKPLLTKHGELIWADRRVPTISGMADYCGFHSIRGFRDQAKRSAGFEEVIRLALMNIERDREERLYTADGYQGARFTLIRQFGWKIPEPEKAADATVRVQVVDAAPADGPAAAAPGVDTPRADGPIPPALLR